MRKTPVATLAALCMLASACGGTDDSADDSPDRPTIVVTTSVLGDVVSNLVGDAATVETIMEAGSDPHDFQASARQAAAMRSADVLVTNGAGFEEGLGDTLDAAEADGATLCVAIEGVDTLDRGGSNSDRTGHDETADPHFFADPARMAVAASGLTDCLRQSVPALDTAEVTAASDGYISELEALDSRAEQALAVVPPERRILVTNHEVLGYLADRYDFDVAGAVIPSASTQAEANAAALADLADQVSELGVPAVFAETSSPEKLAAALAAEAGEVAVVVLFTESLGPDGAETYIEMVETNVARIAGALR